MKIVWDDRKRSANIAKHGLDFADLDDGFFADALIREARSGRYKAIGPLADGTIAVVFALLGSEGIAVISMRPASAHERRLLDDREAKDKHHL